MEDPFTLVTVARGVGPAVAVLLVLVLVRPQLRLRDRREQALAVFLGLVALSSVWSLAPLATMLKAAHLAVVYLLVVLLARLWRDRDEAVREVAWVVVAVTLSAAAFALVAPGLAFQSGSGRLLSVFPGLQPVVLGLFAAMTVVVACVGGSVGGLLARPWLRIGVGSVGAVVLLLTGTRSALLLAVVAVVAHLVLVRGWRSGARVAGAGLALAALAMATPLGSTIRPRLAAAFDGELGNFGGRLPMWGYAIEALQDRPVTGFGYYAGHRLGPYAEAFRLQVNMVAPSYIDGTWPEVALDLGILGVVALGAFVVIASKSVFWCPVPAAARGLHQVLVVMLLVWSILDYTLQQVGYPMIVAAGLLLAPHSGATRTPVRDP